MMEGITLLPPKAGETWGPPLQLFYFSQRGTTHQSQKQGTLSCYSSNLSLKDYGLSALPNSLKTSVHNTVHFYYQTVKQSL